MLARRKKRLFFAMAWAFAVSCAAGQSNFEPPQNKRGDGAWISLRHQQQEQNLCVPTAASMILGYFGDTISPREIKALAMRKSYVPGAAFTDFTITYFKDLISGLASRGDHWREKSYTNDDSGLRKGLREIERSLDSGVPVMIDTTPPLGLGHTVVIAGYSNAQQMLYAVDPNRPTPGIVSIPYSGLYSLWNSQGVGTNFRCAVFPHRR